MIRRVLLGIGLSSTALGLVLLVVPSAGRLGPLALVGVLLCALAVGAYALTDRLSTPRERPTPSRPDGGVDARVPGIDFDRELAAIPGYSQRGAEDREAVRERLRGLAVDRLVRETGCSTATAHDRLDAGAWTDDAVAAALFTDADPSVRSQVRTLLGGRSAFHRRVDRAIVVLETGVTGGAATGDDASTGDGVSMGEGDA